MFNLLNLVKNGSTGPGKTSRRVLRSKTRPFLTLDRPEKFQGKMAVITANLKFKKKSVKTLTD
jgi:hypothetical protein